MFGTKIPYLGTLEKYLQKKCYIGNFHSRIFQTAKVHAKENQIIFGYF